MLARVALLLTLLALAAPTAAVAQNDPLAPLPPPAPTTSEQPAPAPSSRGQAEDDGFGDTTTWLFVAIGIVLLAGIAWLIVRDARRRAPVDDHLAADGPRGTVSPNRHTRARAKAKRSKQARKRNRARR